MAKSKHPTRSGPEGWVPRLVRILRWNLWWRKPLHAFYRWYLRESCGGAHHCGEYGPDGRYIVLMNEQRYHRYMHLAYEDERGERLLQQVRRERDADEDDANIQTLPTEGAAQDS